MTRAHALLSASSAYRWTVCTPAALLEDTFPDSSSWAATEGTIAHAMAEYCLLNDAHPDEVTQTQVPEIRTLIEHFEGEEDGWASSLADMRRHVQSYVEYILSLPGERFIEQRVDFSHLVPDGFGTSDAIILHEDTVHIADLKYGKGKKVFANGPQTKLYALGGLNDYGFIFDGVKKVVLHIFQPRLDHIDTHEMTIEELVSFGEWIKGRADLAAKGEGEFVAGDHCDFCRARRNCRARAEHNKALADHPEEGWCPDPALLSSEEIATLLPNLDQLAKWAKEVKEFALETALEGTRYPGYKLVEGRSNRYFPDEAAVVAAMRAEGLADEQIFNMKLIGITEAEKLLGKKSKVFDLAIKSPGAPTLVPLSDKRQELSESSADADFGETVTQ